MNPFKALEEVLLPSDNLICDAIQPPALNQVCNKLNSPGSPVQSPPNDGSIYPWKAL